MEFHELPDWIQENILEGIYDYYYDIGKPVTRKEAKILASAYKYTPNGMMRKVKEKARTAMRTKEITYKEIIT